jgi:adenosylcobinamide-GDP ribazoletransferase
MTFAPLVGAVLALVTGTVLAFLTQGLFFSGPWAAISPVLAAALTLALLAILTRAMHLDGLADTADGLGSGKSAVAALDIMRSGDVGPFGVITLVFTLLIQVAALAQLTSAGVGPLALALSLVVSRLVLPVVCSRGIPAARPEGLGQVVADSVGKGQLLLAIAFAGVSVVVLAVLTSVVLDVAVDAIVGPSALSVLGLLAGGALCAWCVRRLGGVTGDVMGACVEVTFTATLVVLASI